MNPKRRSFRKKGQFCKMIVELDRFEQDVRELEKKLDETASAFDVDAMRDELDQLHREMEQPDFWNNLERAQKDATSRIKTITDRTQGIADLRAQCEDAHTLIAMCDEEQDESLVPEIESEIQDLTQKIGALYLSTLLRGEYDANDCILSLHAGAAAPRPRTGPRCSTACTPAMPRGTATRCASSTSWRGTRRASSP